MAKVKKRRGLTGVRNTRRVKRSAPKTRAKASPKAKKRKAAPPTPVVRIAVKALDPLRKCGPGTSVQRLLRVDETVDGRTTAHLVFFDRHGWYCEHGRTCPAVAHARKHKGHIARAS